MWNRDFLKHNLWATKLPKWFMQMTRTGWRSTHVIQIVWVIFPNNSLIVYRWGVEHRANYAFMLIISQRRSPRRVVRFYRFDLIFRSLTRLIYAIALRYLRRMYIYEWERTKADPPRLIERREKWQRHSSRTRFRCGRRGRPRPAFSFRSLCAYIRLRFTRRDIIIYSRLRRVTR